MEESQQSRRRRPALQRWISEITDQDTRQRIRVLGSILDIQPVEEENQINHLIILDDGTGSIRIMVKDPITLEIGNQIRVFGILEKINAEDYLITAEIIQNMNDLDLELYKRVEDVKRRFKNSLSSS